MDFFLFSRKESRREKKRDLETKLKSNCLRSFTRASGYNLERASNNEVKLAAFGRATSLQLFALNLGGSSLNEADAKNTGRFSFFSVFVSLSLFFLLNHLAFPYWQRGSGQTDRLLSAPYSLGFEKDTIIILSEK